MNRGLFLTFEGIDGCGKTTQAARLAKRLRASGRQVVETVEPGGTEAGRAIRRVLLDSALPPLDAHAELLLYFASRAQNAAECIRPALARGAILVCDRFTDSTVVYQGAGRGIPQETVMQLHDIACGGLMPDLTLLLDIDLATSLDRARARDLATGSQETRIEAESCAFFDRVRVGYRQLAEQYPNRIRTIDARGPVTDVEARIWEAVSKHV